MFTSLQSPSKMEKKGIIARYSSNFRKRKRKCLPYTERLPSERGL